MENVHLIGVGRIKKSDGRVWRCTRHKTCDRNQALIELKQLVKSLERAGMVHEIEDRESPFNGMQVDTILIWRPQYDENENDPADTYDEVEQNPDDLDFEIEDFDDFEE